MFIIILLEGFNFKKHRMTVMELRRQIWKPDVNEKYEMHFGYGSQRTERNKRWNLLFYI